ncbi:MAG: phage holin family protein [Verrucomicrobiota bacterium]|nr:phage holin family protein [Verrucomicrobiota bacterium]
MRAFFVRWLVTTVAVALAVGLTGMRADNWVSLVGGSLLLGIINALVRPVLLLLSLPFIVATLGLFILVINALLLWLVGSIVPGLHVESFGTAFFAALIVSLVSWFLSAFFRASDGRVYTISHHAHHREAGLKRVEGRVVGKE